MKKLFISLAIGFMLVFAGSAYANGNHDKNSHHHHGHHGDVDVDVDVDTNVRNYNTNMNFNDMEQEQSQAQMQGQLQGQGQKQDQANVQETNITQIVERDFHNAPEINTPGLMQSGTDTMQYNIQRTGNILWIKSTWSRYHLEKMLGTNYSLKSETKSLVDWEPADTIEIVMEMDRIPMDLLGTVTVHGNSKDETFDCLFKAALEALDMGANTLLITGEGVGKILKGFSWGIGFNVSQAKMQGDDSQVTTGGLGVSGGSSEYQSKPWIQTLAIYIYNK